MSIREMGDHRFNRLNDTVRREAGITGDPLGDEFGTLDRDSDPLSPVDEKDPDPLSELQPWPRSIRQVLPRRRRCRKTSARGVSAMGKLQNPLEEGKVEMGLIFKLAFEGLLLLAQVVAGASLHIDEDSRQADPFEVRPVFSIKRFAAGADKSADPRTLELVKCRFEIFVILDGDGVHSEGPGHLAGIAHRTPAAFVTTLLVSVGTIHLLGTIRKKENLGFFHLSEGFQDGKR